MPAKEEDTIPCDILLLDIISPYKIRREGKDPIILTALPMIDPGTRWFEIIRYNNKQSDIITNLLYQNWLCK